MLHVGATRVSDASAPGPYRHDFRVHRDQAEDRVDQSRPGRGQPPQCPEEHRAQDRRGQGAVAVQRRQARHDRQDSRPARRGPEALQHRLDGWTESLKPRNDLEQYLVERAVRVSWQLDRADRAEVARLTAQIRDDAFYDCHSQANVEVVALGRRLFWDRRGPLELYPHFPLKDQLLASKKPRTSFSGLAEDPDEPERLVIQLECSAAGCLWLLRQWADLRDVLDQDLLWQSIDRFKAIRLLGRQPTDAADDCDVTTIYLASWAMHPQANEIDAFQDVYNELLAGEANLFRQRLTGRVVEEFLPADKDEAKAKLLAMVASATDRLKVLLEDHEARPRPRRPIVPPGSHSTTATRESG